ncbi:MAG: hypothetical protein AMJ73_03915 [candidate division Zixibacteria bacterium SM1_73]|nr:MAG: hypothetical protein AMJ73_03915 [candidate division Zixibacteria bacterium SM1_73]
MIVLAYFEQGPGSGTIKRLVSDVVISAAQRIGVNENNLDKIAVAYPEHYEKALQDLTGELFTDSQNYIGFGKTTSKMDQGQLRHSIVFHASIFEAVLKGQIESQSQDIRHWNVEQQCMYFVIPHELGHCKDHEERMIASSKNVLDFKRGFELESIHQYYSEILIDEVCACRFADKYYSEQMITHRISQERQTLNKSYANLIRNLREYSGQENLLRLAANASGWIWLYQIQVAKHIISSYYGRSKKVHLTPLVDIFENCEKEHSILLQAVDFIMEKYPQITEEGKEKLLQAWRTFSQKAGFTFEKRKEGWHFYWN